MTPSACQKHELTSQKGAKVRERCSRGDTGKSRRWPHAPPKPPLSRPGGWLLAGTPPRTQPWGRGAWEFRCACVLPLPSRPPPPSPLGRGGSLAASVSPVRAAAGSGPSAPAFPSTEVSRAAGPPAPRPERGGLSAVGRGGATKVGFEGDPSPTSSRSEGPAPTPSAAPKPRDWGAPAPWREPDEPGRPEHRGQL